MGTEPTLAAGRHPQHSNLLTVKPWTAFPSPSPAALISSLVQRWRQYNSIVNSKDSHVAPEKSTMVPKAQEIL